MFFCRLEKCCLFNFFFEGQRSINYKSIYNGLVGLEVFFFLSPFLLPHIPLRTCSPQLIFNSVQFNSIQFSSDQFRSVQFSSALDNTFTLTYHHSFQFSSVQFSSVQFSSDQFSSVQISLVQFSPAVLCRREHALKLPLTHRFFLLTMVWLVLLGFSISLSYFYHTPPYTLSPIQCLFLYEIDDLN